MQTEYTQILARTERRRRWARRLRNAVYIVLFIASIVGIGVCVRINLETRRQIELNEATRKWREVRYGAWQDMQSSLARGETPDGLARFLYFCSTAVLDGTISK